MFDLELGELLAMAVEAAIAFATFFLENNHVLTFDEGIHHLANNFGTFDGRCAHCDSTVGIHEQDFVEFNGIALFLLVAEIVDKQFLAGLGAELLSLNFYNCVHLNNCITSLSVRRSGPCPGTYLCLSDE